MALNQIARIKTSSCVCIQYSLTIWLVKSWMDCTRRNLTRRPLEFIGFWLVWLFIIVYRILSIRNETPSLLEGNKCLLRKQGVVVYCATIALFASTVITVD